jgi:hypothetical protein
VSSRRVRASSRLRRLGRLDRVEREGLGGGGDGGGMTWPAMLRFVS